MRKADSLPPSCAVVMKSGNLNFLEPSGPLQACNGTVLPFFSRHDQEICLFSKTYRQALDISQRDAILVSEALDLRIKTSGHEADHSRASRVEVKNRWS